METEIASIPVTVDKSHLLMSNSRGSRQAFERQSKLLRDAFILEKNQK